MGAVIGIIASNADLYVVFSGILNESGVSRKLFSFSS